MLLPGGGGVQEVQYAERTFYLNAQQLEGVSRDPGAHRVQLGCLEGADEVPLRFHWPKHMDLRVNNMPMRCARACVRMCGEGWGGAGRGYGVASLSVVCGAPRCCTSSHALTHPGVPPAAAAAAAAAPPPQAHRPYGRALYAKMGINQRDDVANISECRQRRVLCCAVLWCGVVCCGVLCCAVLCCAVLCRAVTSAPDGCGRPVAAHQG